MAPEKILVIHVTRIGDTLLTTPALRAISAAWPHAKLTFMGHPKRSEVIENLPYVHDVKGITKKTAFWKNRIQPQRWDLAVVFGFDDALIHYALRVAKKVIAWQQNDANINKMLHKAIPKPPNDSMTAVDMLNTLPCQGLNIPPQGRHLDFKVTKEERCYAQRLITATWGHSPAPLLGMVTESFPTKPYRDWPIDHFIDLCQKTAQKWPSAHFVILGGEADSKKLKKIKQALGDDVLILTDKLSLRESGAIISLLDLYIGVDTGPTHLAGAIGHIPVISLYHCLHRASVLAPLEHAQLSALDHPHSHSQCDTNSCMSEINVKRVWNEVQKYLDI